ncbi:MAG: hypothetical protein OXU66_05965 [Gammaproteobacteria bacterium]|nr:hypothetical protein [Gammaproteobacteria bacterium]
MKQNVSIPRNAWPGERFEHLCTTCETSLLLPKNSVKQSCVLQSESNNMQGQKVFRGLHKVISDNSPNIVMIMNLSNMVHRINKSFPAFITDGEIGPPTFGLITDQQAKKWQ